MYYYAYIDSDNICTGVYALPSAITADGYIVITQEQYESQSVVGMHYNSETGEWEDPVIFSCSTDEVRYKQTNGTLSAKLDAMDESIAAAGVDAYTKTESDARYATVDHTHSGYATADHTHTGYASSSHTHGASDLSGVVKTINGTAPDSDGNVMVSVSGGGMTAAEILSAVKTVDGADSGLDADTVDGKHASDFATADHTHSGYATAESVSGKADATHTHSQSDVTGLESALNGKADTTHTHSQDDVTGLSSALSGKADTNHTHTGYATTEALSALQDTVDDKADSNHTHTEYASASDVSALQTTVSGKADANHTHTGYAASSHTHSQSEITGLASALSGKADASHTHSGYASSSHTHTPSSIGAASASHTHSEYASSSHTHSTFSSAVDVNGAIKSNGVQVGYNSGTDTTLGSNNYPTIVAGSYVTLNGEKTYAPNIYPRNTGTFYLGAQSNRWSGIYSKVAVNVSSDRRLKENIEELDRHEAVKLINAVKPVSFNYIGDDNEQIGVIAQDILGISPELAKAIVTQGDDGYYGVKTSDLVFPLIVAVQELKKEVDELRGSADDK